MPNSPKVIAGITDDDLELTTLLSKEYGDCTDEDFERTLDILLAGQARWHEEEVRSAAEGRKTNPNKGLRKPKQTKARVDELTKMDVSVDLGDLGL